MRPQLPHEVGDAVIGSTARFRSVVLFKSCFDVTAFHAANADEFTQKLHLSGVRINNGVAKRLEVQMRSPKVLAQLPALKPSVL